MASILGFNLGHDGSVVLLKNSSLEFSLEQEKDSHPRYSHLNLNLALRAIQLAGGLPEVIAISGWSVRDSDGKNLLQGYHGIDQDLTALASANIFGNSVQVLQTTHERSHIFCSYGLSPFPQGQPCYALVWEGEIGAFYEIDEELNIRCLGRPLDCPGYKYSFAFDLANPGCEFGAYRLASAGKLMALTSYSSRTSPTEIERRAIDQILREVVPPRTDKQQFAWSPYLNCGVTDEGFTEFAGKLSDAIFQQYFSFARAHLRRHYPLLIAGGCGLNCDWNVRWKDSGLFPGVFVPPVTNDSGSALGAAIEANHQIGLGTKISWSVYSGLDFAWDHREDPDWLEKEAADFDLLARLLADDRVFAWVNGRCEMGPRALGNRSLIAAPFRKEMRDRLNWIKYREDYRPVAPVCLQEDARELFGVDGESPFMLYTYQTRAKSLEAITHVDGTARVQTVSFQQNPALYSLLQAFKRETGFGVLCNTSLNFPGKGFINRSSDLFRYIKTRQIDGALIGEQAFLPKGVRSSCTRQGS